MLDQGIGTIHLSAFGVLPCAEQFTVQVDAVLVTINGSSRNWISAALLLENVCVDAAQLPDEVLSTC